jgi:Flp pilus assembly protein TadD
VEKALELKPTDVRALSVLNQSYIAQKQTAMGLKAVEGYASQQPRSAATQEFLGMVLEAKGDRLQARKAFMAAKTADPHFMHADFALAQLDMADGKPDDARSRLSALLPEHPNNPTVHLWLGVLENAKGNDKGAIEHFQKVVDTDPNNPQALNNLAYLLARQGNQLPAALRYAQRAQALAPDNPEYADTLGWVLYQQGLYSPALMQLEHAVSRGNNAIWRYHLAMACARTGDSRRARTILQETLNQAPGTPEAKLAREVVQGAR